jgi:hypothetical protein
MAGKYTPLENYLRDLPANQREVTLGFDQIESILNSKFGDSCHSTARWRLEAASDSSRVRL